MLARELADARALIEDRLERRPDLALRGVGLVNRPPERTMAPEALGELRFREPHGFIVRRAVWPSRGVNGRGWAAVQLSARPAAGLPSLDAMPPLLEGCEDRRRSPQARHGQPRLRRSRAHARRGGAPSPAGARRSQRRSCGSSGGDRHASVAGSGPRLPHGRFRRSASPRSRTTAPSRSSTSRRWR